MDKIKEYIDADTAKTIQRRRRNFIILFLIVVFVSFRLSGFIISVLLPDFQHLIECKNGIISYSDCKYIGLASIIAAPWIIVFLIAAIVITALLFRKKQTINYLKQIDTTTNVILYLTITICIIMALFIISTIIYGIIAWTK